MDIFQEKLQKFSLHATKIFFDKIVSFFGSHPPSAVATGAQGGCAPLTTACAPPFWFTQITIFGTSRNCKTTTMMAKGVIMFKHNSPLKFS